MRATSVRAFSGGVHYSMLGLAEHPALPVALRGRVGVVDRDLVLDNLEGRQIVSLIGVLGSQV